MKIHELVRAMQVYDVQRRMLIPERFVAYDLFQDCFPDRFPPVKGPGGYRGPETEKLRRAAASLLGGERLEEEAMIALFGFGNAQLDEALKAADPVVREIPEKLVLMTFDDSTIDHYQTACPVLEKYGGKANLFTAETQDGPFGPGFHDKTTHMTWEQIKELSDRGHQICNHSLHHDFGFAAKDEAYMLAEIRGLEERCEKYGIPKPDVFGYPGGPGTPIIGKLLHENGYKWGRGDLKGTVPLKLGQTLYDPYADSPMFVPSVTGDSLERLRELLDKTAGGHVLQLVYHDVNHDRHVSIPFEDQVRCIYEYGGRCITYRELEEYIDPLKAYAWTVGE